MAFLKYSYFEITVMTSQFLCMTLPATFYHVTEITLQMQSCNQSLVTLAFLGEKLQPQFYKDFTRKTTFFEGWSWIKFNNLGLALSITLRFYPSVAKGLKLKVIKFCGLISMFVEVNGEKLVVRPNPILDWVNKVYQLSCRSTIFL